MASLHKAKMSRRLGFCASTLFLGCLLTTATLNGLSTADAAPGSSSSVRQASRNQTTSPSQPVPFKGEGTVGPWRMTVLDVVTGDEATTRVVDASAQNAGPSDDVTYVAVRIQVVNAGNQRYQVDFNDFGVVGDSGIVRRFVGAIPPDPALDAVLAPGEQTEGWLVATASTEDGNLILLYDSTTIDGTWADGAFALSDGAQIPSLEKRPIALNKLGRDPASPVGYNTQVVTRDWAIELLDVRQGADVIGLFPSGDYRTTALLGDDPSSSPDSQTWIAFQIRVTNNRTGDSPAYFSPTALTAANGDGSPVPDLWTLSAPDPATAGWYLPGATTEAWYLLNLESSTKELYGGALLRFAPSGESDDIRYLAWDGSGISGSPEPAFTGTLAVGTRVTVIEDQVRMRSGASTEAKIVKELTRGTELVVTGAPEDGDGFTWYPVEDPKTGNKGYIAQQFIEPIS